jgi:hypothetical protein
MYWTEASTVINAVQQNRLCVKIYALVRGSVVEGLL